MSIISSRSTPVHIRVVINGNMYYLANYTAGLRVLDITNISDAMNPMQEIGFFDTRPENNATSFNGAWSVYPYFPSGNIVINDIERGLFVVGKISNLSTNQSTIGTFSVSPNPTQGDTTINSSGNTVINSVEVYTLLGQKLYDFQNLNVNQFIIPFSQNKSGIYLVKINDSLTKKIVVK